MRIPPLLADFIYNRGCELKCEKFLTRPQNGIDHRSRAGQIDEVFARVISENAICAALSQNENTPIDPFAVLLIIERLCIPG